MALDDTRNRLYLIYGLTQNLASAMGNVIVATNNMTVVSAAGVPTWDGQWQNLYGGFNYDNNTRICFWSSFATLSQTFVDQDYWNPYGIYYWFWQYSVTGMHYIYKHPKLNMLNLDSSGEIVSGYTGNHWYYYYFNCDNMTSQGTTASFGPDQEVRLYNLNPCCNVPPFDAPINNNNSLFYAWKWGGFHTNNYMYTAMYSIKTPKSHGSIIVQWQLPLNNFTWGDYYSAKTELVFPTELHFQTIYVDEAYGVVFIGTGDGYVKKMTYTDNGVSQMNITYPPYNGLQNLDNTTTQNITYQQFDWPNKRFFYSTSQTVYSAPIYNCALGAANCSSCAALGEPYCSWCNVTSTCTDAAGCPTGSWSKTCH